MGRTLLRDTSIGRNDRRRDDSGVKAEQRPLRNE